MSLFKRILSVLILAGFIQAGVAEEKNSYSVVSAHPLASQAGERILNAGGNAFDAAVAVSAALAVVEPYGSGIGGGGFWLLHQASTHEDIVIDGREVAPSAAHATMYLDADGKLTRDSIDGPLAAGIPGVVAALEVISEKYGSLSLAENLQPAIELATSGFIPGDHYSRLASLRLQALLASPAASKTFLQDGKVPAKDFVIRQPELAASLKLIAQQGAEVFYRGELAHKLVEGVRAAGGIWTLQDLEQYRVQVRAPLQTTYRGLKIIMPPPPTSGGVVIAQILAMLEDFDLTTLSSVDYTHMVVEAMRRAYRDRALYLGDPDFLDIPMQILMSKAYAQDNFADFSREHATSNSDLAAPIRAAGEDTTHFSILDGQGNYVAATLSINYPFGSGFMVPQTGILLNDEMDDFSMGLGTPNVWGLVGGEANKIEPGKRMLSSMTPLFARDDARTLIVGTPGGSRIISMLTLALLEFSRGSQAEQIVSRKRFHHQYLPDEIQFEQNALTKEEQDALTEKGHKLNELSRRYGNMHAIIWHHKQNKIDAAADPRGEGLAIVKSASD